ncbi:ASCH domain-containing protein [Saccharopolyspora sp. NFXS83]|uniref:ASCH domain-containing protein n=1 Tax=Saccharopolyspora sp. NFXS83 TaxID=2993560 RepID=UPI00224A7798|nr:ASCH domain-containing protein [Saccharopolyspora sp. NFXS83]MCX2731659.1 ASCH domain-containing protein [Saccharopolyspora sp. NFXS83]
MLTDRELELVRRATAVLDGATLNENHQVSAAAYDATGAVFTGMNVSHFTGGPCAEPVVIGQAAASGAAPLTTIVAVLARGMRVIPPCGRCRQQLFDYYPDARAIIRGENGLESVPITDLLPFPYDYQDYEPDAPPIALHLWDGYLDAVRNGTKRSTVRVHDPVVPGPIRLIFEHDGGSATTLAAEVTEVEHRTVAELTEQDAVLDGFANLAELRTALDAHYPGLTGATELDLVRFATTG